jgi:hypothetical protein
MELWQILASGIEAEQHEQELAKTMSGNQPGDGA